MFCRFLPKSSTCIPVDTLKSSVLSGVKRMLTCSFHERRLKLVKAVMLSGVISLSCQPSFSAAIQKITSCSAELRFSTEMVAPYRGGNPIMLG